MLAPVDQGVSSVVITYDARPRAHHTHGRRARAPRRVQRLRGHDDQRLRQAGRGGRRLGEPRDDDRGGLAADDRVAVAEGPGARRRSPPQPLRRLPAAGDPGAARPVLDPSGYPAGPRSLCLREALPPSGRGSPATTRTTSSRSPRKGDGSRPPWPSPSSTRSSRSRHRPRRTCCAPDPQRPFSLKAGSPWRCSRHRPVTPVVRLSSRRRPRQVTRG